MEVIPVFVDEKLGAPRGGHVEYFFLIRFFFVLVTSASVLAFTIFIGFVFFYHDILPFSSYIFLEVKVDSFDFTVWFQVDPEVLMVEDGLNREVGTAVKLVFAASSRFNKNGPGHLAGAGKNHDPCVDSASAILIFAFVIGLIIVNDLLTHFGFMRFSLQPGLSFVIKYGFVRLACLNGEAREGAIFLNNLDFHVLFVFVSVWVFVLHLIFKFGVKGAIHQRLVFSGDGFGCCAIYNKCVVASTDEQRAEHNSDIKAVTCLPLEHVCWRGDGFGQLVWVIQLFVLKVVRTEGGASLIVVELHVGHLCWPDCGADKFAETTFVDWGHKKLAGWIVNNFELACILKDMLKH